MGEIEKPLAEISKKLDNIQRLMAIIAVRGIETEQGKIDLLDRLGFKPVEIANFLGKSPDNIGVQLSIIRKKRQKAVKVKETEEGVADNQQQQLPSDSKLTEIT
jgi:hypothetical protein